MFATGSDARGVKVTWYSGRPVACLEENTLFEYLCDRLDVVARDAVAEHAASCDSCRQMIAAASLQLTRTTTGEVGAVGSAPPLGPPPPGEPREPEPDRGSIGCCGRSAAAVWAPCTRRQHLAGWRVAVKQLRSAASGDPTAAQRFLREARSASRITHPNVVDILDLGQDPDTGALFMVQEFWLAPRCASGSPSARRRSTRWCRSLPALSAPRPRTRRTWCIAIPKPDNIFPRDASGREPPS
jgi:hypothetical protein